MLVLVPVSCGVKAREGRMARTADVPGGLEDPTSGGTPTTEARKVEILPLVELKVTGDDGNPLNKIATTAVSDLEQYWTVEFPKVYDDKYVPLKGGLFAYGSDTDPSTLPCPADSIDAMMGNAFYCPTDDAVAWDQEQLLPYLASEYGDFTVAVVLAHEWGHVIQQRAGGFEASVFTELQADCFAGSWVAHVHDSTRTHFDVNTAVLDQALGGVLFLKDAPGITSDEPTAHGSGFDRVGAFQDGFENGAAACKGYLDGKVQPFQFPFTSQADLDNEGNLPLEDSVDLDGQTVPGIKTQAISSLEDYWTKEFPKLGGGTWKRLQKPVEFDKSDPPTCDGEEVTSFRLFLCVPEHRIGYSSDLVEQAYKRYGDFGVATLLGSQYGLDVQVELDDVPDDVTLMTRRGDCYTGAWTAEMIPDENGDPADPDLSLVLSPGDLDEAVGVLLGIRSESDRIRQGPGFDRVRAFRTGVLQGAEACKDLKD
ncbi:MAG: neutral zinc metallopeptidase [Acidimicrobiales bacterium]|nr:neutral zinc metallopeptidase [Acidimicrobiales bacterium]